MFPLQCCGWDVDAVHTTNYLNHPGRGTFEGARSDGEHVVSLLDGLRRLFDLRTHYHAVLIGYCPSAEVMAAVYRELGPLFEGAGPKPVFVVDPVLGDHGRLYVPEEVLHIHMDFLKLGYVDLTTPNQFEMELLTGMQMQTWDDVRAAALRFHQQYKVANFVVLSVLIDRRMFSVGFSANTARVFCIPIEKI